MYSRPTLPPLLYRLWLPHLSLYVRETDPINDRFTGTGSQERAVVLPEPEARHLALELIRARGVVVELKTADKGNQ